MSTNRFHETFDRSDDVRVGSNRGFGYVFTGVFLILALLRYRHGLDLWMAIWLGAAAAMMGVTLIAPGLLGPLNKLWFRFGLLLHKIVSPLVMGAIFFGVVTPTGLVMRMRGKRPLNLAFEPEAPTYWVDRNPPGPKPATFQNQF
ncbi:SxtJ family membrane protein [Rhodopseudomonas sp. NSM]|uniref:SxtJ family membrane protein n=1 Tax=Rhodopseudomonas sp. NSM TaxID=3457630 RepID=UPI004036BD06